MSPTTSIRSALIACALLAGPAAAQSLPGEVERLARDIDGLRREVRRQRGDLSAARREIAVTRRRMSVLEAERDRLRAEVRVHAADSARAGAAATAAALTSLCILGVLFWIRRFGVVSRSPISSVPAAKPGGDLTGRIRALDGRLRELEGERGPQPDASAV